MLNKGTLSVMQRKKYHNYYFREQNHQDLLEQTHVLINLNLESLSYNNKTHKLTKS